MGNSEYLDATIARCPVVLLIDTSCYMPKKIMSLLFSGTKSFSMHLKDEEAFGAKVEPAIITFGGEVQMVQDFICSDSLSMPAFEAAGTPCLGASLGLGLKLIENRTKFYERHDIEYDKPWLFMISSGKTNEAEYLQDAVLKAQEADIAGSLSYHIVGVPGAEMGLLRDIASPFNPPMQMKEFCFDNLFRWLTSSIQRVRDVKTGAGYLPSHLSASLKL